jgi:mannan endo-1,4-beta-mannosidase
MRGYPGDDIIDMLSLDMYDRGEQFGSELDKALEFVTNEAISRNKLTALSETGGRRGKDDWWTTVLLPAVEKYPVGYVLTWRNTYSTRWLNMENPQQPFPDDFLNFYNSPHSMFLNEIQEPNVYTRK